MTEKQAIEMKMNELASKIMSGEMLESFLQLPLDGKVAGIGFFASLAGEKEVVNMCEYAMKVLGA